METETLPAISLLAGESHWLLRDQAAYAAYFGADSIFATGVVDVDYSVHGGISQNGDDAIELFRSGAVVDIFGDINVDGSNTAWEYKDSFATRNVDVSAPSVTFDQSQWIIAGYGPAGFVAGESGDECSDDSTTSCDSACGQYPSFPDCPAPAQNPQLGPGIPGFGPGIPGPGPRIPGRSPGIPGPGPGIPGISPDGVKSQPAQSSRNKSV